MRPDPDPHPGGAGVSAKPLPVEDLGTWVTMRRSTDLAWSADGTEIFYFAVTGTCSFLEAVNIVSRLIRVVTDSVCNPSRLRLSADGTMLFYQIVDEITDEGARSRIYRVPSSGGAAQMQVERVLPSHVPFMAGTPTAMNTEYAV